MAQPIQDIVNVLSSHLNTEELKQVWDCLDGGGTDLLLDGLGEIIAQVDPNFFHQSEVDKEEKEGETNG